MITRAQMPRQLRNMGGITNAVPREKYGLGSKLKERFRKLIPNELADVAVAAAPFVAPFNPGIAGLMRGIGRFDQRGSISDALKQGAATFGFGKAAGFLGGAKGPGGIFGKQTFTKEGFRQGPVGKRLFKEDIQASIVHVEMLFKQKIISFQIKNKIIWGLNRIKKVLLLYIVILQESLNHKNLERL